MSSRWSISAYCFIVWLGNVDFPILLGSHADGLTIMTRSQSFALIPAAVWYVASIAWQSANGDVLVAPPCCPWTSIHTRARCNLCSNFSLYVRQFKFQSTSIWLSHPDWQFITPFRLRWDCLCQSPLPFAFGAHLRCSLSRLAVPVCPAAVSFIKTSLAGFVVLGCTYVG